MLCVFCLEHPLIGHPPLVGGQKCPYLTGVRPHASRCSCGSLKNEGFQPRRHHEDPDCPKGAKWNTASQNSFAGVQSGRTLCGSEDLLGLRLTYNHNESVTSMY